MWVSVVSVTGAPGVSTVALGLAACWPVGWPLLVEADPAGGDVSARFDVAPGQHLGLVSTVGRGSAGGDGLVQPPGVQWLPCGVPAVVAPPGAGAGARLRALSASDGGGVRDSLRRVWSSVVVDGGRWWPGTPADVLVTGADVVLVVLTPVLGQVQHVRQWRERLRELGARVALVVVPYRGGWPAARRGSWPAREVGRALGLPVAADVPYDRTGAAVLAGRLAPAMGWHTRGRRSWTRLALPAACRGLARHLAKSESRVDVSV